MRGVRLDTIRGMNLTRRNASDHCDIISVSRMSRTVNVCRRSRRATPQQRCYPRWRFQVAAGPVSRLCTRAALIRFGDSTFGYSCQ